MRGHRVDGNHAEIVHALRQLGAVVVPMTGDPKIGFDLLVALQGRLHAVEIKDGAKPPSARTLTAQERKRQQEFASVGVTYHVVENLADVLLLR